MRHRGRSIWLANMINTKQYLIGAEIGAAIGLTTAYVLEKCPLLDKYIVVDDWRPAAQTGPFASDTMKQTFLKVLGKERKLQILEGISWEMSSTIEDGSLDFVFIDASHDYESVKRDINAWKPKVRSGGLLCGHDEHWDGVREALKELLPDYSLAGVDNVWYELI